MVDLFRPGDWVFFNPDLVSHYGGALAKKIGIEKFLETPRFQILGVREAVWRRPKRLTWPVIRGGYLPPHPQQVAVMAVTHDGQQLISWPANGRIHWLSGYLFCHDPVGRTARWARWARFASQWVKVFFLGQFQRESGESPDDFSAFFLS